MDEKNLKFIRYLTGRIFVAMELAFISRVINILENQEHHGGLCVIRDWVSLDGSIYVLCRIRDFDGWRRRTSTCLACSYISI